ncbi:MAG: type II toxin-antitoxin system VapC family toxin [Bacteroidetes bacterium]|nr:type II toxin-antitoxin system VapC family toxin [Bacteroidota bacterium]
MVGYLDSSVVLRHILLGDAGIQQVFASGRVISSELLEIECRRVLHRCRLQGELDDDSFIIASDRLDQVISGVSILVLSSKVKKRAADAFPVIIKTLDALHLASALIFQTARPAESLLIFSYDAGMNRCARALGLPAPFAVESV